MTILVSVIIPVYNRTWQLRRGLQSLVEQTFRQFEVIVCDDGSTDDVRTIVAEFKELLPIEFIRTKNSGGPARPRNIAVSRARGEWISFLDSDDWWDSHRLESIVVELNKEVDLLYHPLRYAGRGGRSVRLGMSKIVGFPMQGNPLRYMALFGNPIPTSATVVRRDMFISIGGMREEFNLVEDFDMWLRLAEIDARIHFLDATLGSYWLSDDSIGVITEKYIHKMFALFEYHLPYFADFETGAKAMQNYMLGSMWKRVAGHKHLAREHLLQAKCLPTISLRMKRLIKLATVFFVR